MRSIDRGAAESAVGNRAVVHHRLLMVGSPPGTPAVEDHPNGIPAETTRRLF
jgi:hypothetical protein